jgi:hypothetical protein
VGAGLRGSALFSGKRGTRWRVRGRRLLVVQAAAGAAGAAEVKKAHRLCLLNDGATQSAPEGRAYYFERWKKVEEGTGGEKKDKYRSCGGERAIAHPSGEGASAAPAPAPAAAGGGPTSGAGSANVCVAEPVSRPTTPPVPSAAPRGRNMSCLWPR